MRHRGSWRHRRGTGNGSPDHHVGKSNVLVQQLQRGLNDCLLRAVVVRLNGDNFLRRIRRVSFLRVLADGSGLPLSLGVYRWKIRSDLKVRNGPRGQLHHLGLIGPDQSKYVNGGERQHVDQERPSHRHPCNRAFHPCVCPVFSWLAGNGKWRKRRAKQVGKIAQKCLEPRFVLNHKLELVTNRRLGRDRIEHRRHSSLGLLGKQRRLYRVN